MSKLNKSQDTENSNIAVFLTVHIGRSKWTITERFAFTVLGYYINMAYLRIQAFFPDFFPQKFYFKVF